MKQICIVFLLAIIGNILAAPARFTVKEQGFEVMVRDHKTGKLVDSGSDIEIKTESTEKGRRNFFRMTFSVPEKSPKVYLLTVTATVGVKSADHYFDGFKESSWDGKKALERNSIFQTFPLAAAWAGNTGIALGLSPDSTVSYMRNGIERANGKNQIFFTTRIVADNRREQELTFCFFTFNPEFGWRNAIDEYYRQYPEYFEPAPNVDPRIYGIGGYYVSTHTTRNLEIHSGRQMDFGWEWTYCPWVMAGNWFVERNEWKPSDGYMHWATYWKRKPCSYDDYLKAETMRFSSGDRQAAMLFYILVKDTGKEIVERFPDSRHKDRHGNLDQNSFLYSLPDNKNKTYLTFAYGSGLSSYLENELREVVKNYQISGFALDMTNHAGNEYNDAQLKYAVGRSFDDDGKIYTADSILPIPFAQYIHSLKRNGKTMAVYMNHAMEAQPALPVFYADGVMFEGNPEMQIDNFKSLRLMSGRKPMTFWGALGTEERNNAINWNLARRPEIKEHILQGLAQYLLFNCLRYGVSPMNWAVAYRDGHFFRPYLETITDLKRAGWQVVPAVKWDGDAELWCGRFGTGKDTIFTVTNPTNETVATQIKLINSYLDGFVPKAVTGQKIEPTIHDNVTEFSIRLQPKEIMILRDSGWKAPVQPVLLSAERDIVDFFTLDNARNGNINVVVPEPSFRVIYDYLDRYYPYIQGCRELNGGIFTREPRLLNPKYNDCWRLPVRDSLGTGKQIVIGPPAQFPELGTKPGIDEKSAENGFIKVIPERSVLWIGGKNLAATRRAADYYFELMDRNLQKRNRDHE